MRARLSDLQTLPILSLLVAAWLLMIAGLTMSPGSPAAAQVATLRTPDPEAEATTAPMEEIDDQEAILQFLACLRDNGIDIPDPQFGAEGGFFGGGALPDIDLMSREFIGALEACRYLLEARQPDLDAEQRAEQNEQLLGFAQCMRRESIDFPDPDPIRGFTFGSLRGDDGRLRFDPFDPDFQAASLTCSAEIGLEPPDPTSS